MTKIDKLLLAALAAAALPGAAMAQGVPDTADVPDMRDAQTGTRIQPILVIGAIRDSSAPQRAEQPADGSVPELPVVYEDDARPVPGN